MMLGEGDLVEWLSKFTKFKSALENFTLSTDRGKTHQIRMDELLDILHNGAAHFESNRIFWDEIL